MYRQAAPPSRVVISTAPAPGAAAAAALAAPGPCAGAAAALAAGGPAGWRLFRPCRHEREDGLYAMLPADYFPVHPSSKPLLVRAPAPAAALERPGDAVHFECVPAPRKPLQFYRQLYDGTFVKLPHNFPDECYEDEAPPADRFYLNVDVDPQSLPPEDMDRYFTRLPDAFQRELRERVPGPTAVPLPHHRYVLRLGGERLAGGRYTEDCFELIDTRLLRLERRPGESNLTAAAERRAAGGPIRPRLRLTPPRR
ncbi:virion protein V67 [Cervid alphaherpesvirus 2]|uniref:Virion protein V67 n=1 Tax=Cervid alphaherpesvirus 2 TaxID=365327 RepID=A0A455JNE9_9ALPH|nr:virion protein V67 [Cervid alphaherpesvirus 2]AVT50784.1 virion protein V67 [Cervid alphaherpesvirus 2]